MADEGTSPSADMHGGVPYRRHLVRTLTERALLSARQGTAGPARSR
ncbi:MAG: hypothetical protein ABI181_10205 [Mycobacteriaceae bacterium]